MSNNVLSRRAFLRGTGVVMALPMLDAMLPRLARGAAGGASDVPRRMIAIETNQGIVPQYFFPQKSGKGYDLSPYLSEVKDHVDDMTVLSGVSHPEVDGGHGAEACFLTAAPHPGRGGFRNTVSLDQYAAERIGDLTRFPSLTLSTGTRASISYTGAGVQIPGEERPSQVFKRLFVQGSASEVDEQVARLRQGQSILDSVASRAKTLQARVGNGDRDKLDQYFTGVRELERRLHKGEQWEQKPKPKVTVPPPTDYADPGALVEKIRSMLDIAQLAIQTDSTRLITLYIYQNGFKPNIEGVTEATHPLTHHGNQPEKLAQLKLIESAQFRELSRLLAGLKSTHEGGQRMLDRTMVLFGTPMGNANAHSNVNLPVVFAGGGFRHGQHLVFDRERNYPLPNLFVSMLQRLGIETNRFASGTSTMRGLEMMS
jgi:hypothetical protein